MVGTWTRLAHEEVTGSAGTLVLSSIPARGNLMVVCNMKHAANGSAGYFGLVFNDDGESEANGKYAGRRSHNGGNDQLTTSAEAVAINSAYSETNWSYSVTHMSNNDGRVKLCKSYFVGANSDGANLPRRVETAATWHGTDQVNKIQLTDHDGDKAVTFAVGSYVTVYGATDDTSTDEKTTLTDVPANSRYEETDTRKIFRRAILKDNCIAYYNFDSTTGGLVNQATTTNGFTDGLGSSADGTVSGATLDTTNEKLGTGCYDFDGTNDYVNLGTNSGLNLLNGGTICMWINYDDMTDKRWAGKGSNGAWEVLSEGGATVGKIKFRVNDGSVENVISTTTLSSSTWYHVGAVYDKSAGQIKIYINGTLEATTSSIGQIATVSTATYFGRNEGGAYVNGRIDDTGIWNVALSGDQISALYNSGTGRTVNTAGAWKERNTA